MEQALDLNSHAFTTFHIMMRTFTLSLDILSASVIFICLFFSFAIRSSSNVLLLAMAIQMANDLMGTFQTSIRLSSDLQSYMANINRCLQYTRAIPEAPLSTYKKERKIVAHTKSDYKVSPMETEGTSREDYKV